MLIVGSGSFTQDLSEFRGHGPNDPTPDWANGFADWFQTALTERREDDLLNYRRLAPFAAQAERLHASATYSVLRIDVYAFRDRNETVRYSVLRIDVYAFRDCDKAIQHAAA